jgi:valyl-tRNA synthetase
VATDLALQHLHGKFAVHPFVDRRIPIVTDDIVVDMSFGTGAVKITPAHDPNDYDVGVRHKLDFINILNDDGTFNANAGAHFQVCTSLRIIPKRPDQSLPQGMKRFHARVEVVKRLKELGLYIEAKDNPMQIPMCRCAGHLRHDVKPTFTQ